MSWPRSTGALRDSVWLGPNRKRPLLQSCFAAAGLVEIAGKPEWPYRATLLGILVGAVVAARRSQDPPLIVAAWALAVVLALLSLSSQLLGVIAWTTFASLAGRCAAVRACDDRAVVAGCLAVVAFRFGCFAVFERVVCELEGCLCLHRTDPGQRHEQ